MFRRALTLALALPLAAAVLFAPERAMAQNDPVRPVGAEQYTTEELENLLGPVALYPDALLAQVLIAATFPEQIEEAASFVRANGTDRIDEQPWDVSVKAVAHYPTALNNMAEKLDWTAALGRAYAGQSTDVMRSVQRLRTMAATEGNLESNEQQQVVVEENHYTIVPAQPQIIYVPVYDPYVVYRRPIFHSGFRSPYFSFGIGFPIGSWLIYDVNWAFGSIYYNGWDRSYFGYGGGWRARSFPFIHVTNIYVNSRYRNVYSNSSVWRRPINYRNVNRYASVHRDRFVGPRGWNSDDRGVRGSQDYGRGTSSEYERTRTRTVERSAERAGSVDRQDRGRNAIDRAQTAQSSDARQRTAAGQVNRTLTGTAATGRSATRTTESASSNDRRARTVESTRSTEAAVSRRTVPTASPSARTTTPSPVTRRSVPTPTRATPSTERRSEPTIERRTPAVERRAPAVERRAPSVERKNPPTVERRAPTVERKSAPKVERPAPDKPVRRGSGPPM